MVLEEFRAAHSGILDWAGTCLRYTMRASSQSSQWGALSTMEVPSQHIVLMEEQRYRVARELHDGRLGVLPGIGVRLRLHRKLSEDGN